ncbi:hypothetical protein CPB83DRAFT_863028 [Crepidotus variabilis]|uniref:F-box domain-containing protein n=1 Tax=Crepidotus variabilis TaxID=179855 RepID=A0A9P6E6K0_9AGAR|nr:hypothetical protein CPB83DRAFT_863028 [Crepidotus variabilis]
MDIDQPLYVDLNIPPNTKWVTEKPPAYHTSSSSSSSWRKALEAVSHQVDMVDGRSSCDQSSRSTASPPPEFPALSDPTLVNVLPSPPYHYADKLYTNYIPSIPQITEIKQYVAEVRQKISLFDDRAAELEAALQELYTKRSQLSEIATAHAALISPVRRLPPEILQLIFVFCLSSTRNAVMHASEAPVLLGRVCSEWRRISLATPEVWSSLHIVPPNVNFSNPASSSSRFQRKKDLIEMWLTRSGACPLSVSFVWFAGDSAEEIKLCGILLQSILPMCGRWKILDFQVPLKMFQPFIGLTVDDVPLLEGISLMDNRTPLDSDEVDRWPESLNFAEGASKLRTFTLTFFSGGIRLPSIPWSQLTTLYLESNIAFFFSDSREMLTAFANCENLQSCTLKFPLSHTATLPAFEKLDMPITLPHLAVLCLDGDQHLHNTFHMSNTLMNLVTPKLRKLEILGRSGRPDGSVAPEPLSAIRTLLERSRCPLERLHVESITILAEAFISCLRLVPQLKDLIIHHWAVRVHSGGYSLGMPPLIEEGNENVPVGGTVDQEGQGEGVGDIGTEVAPNISVTSVPRKEEEITENQILKALTIRRPPNTSKRNHSTESFDVEASHQHPNASDGLPICPRLRSFDFTMCDASQVLLCNFVSSRWEGIPESGLSFDSLSEDGLLENAFVRPQDSPFTSPSSTLSSPTNLGAVEDINEKTRVVTRIKSVKCNFTAFEEEGTKKRMQKFRIEGLDAQITYQMPLSEEINPSPWTGLDTPT